MNNFFKAAIVLALTGITQVASSKGTKNYNQVDDRGERARYRWLNAGEARTNKVIDNAFTFRPRLNARISRLRLVGTGDGVIIRSVIVEYRNGRSEELRRLEGRLREGQRIAVNLSRDRRIEVIRVVATSESLRGSRGTFRVELGVEQ